MNVEIRKVIVSLLQRGYTYIETAQALQVGRATVSRVWREFREEGRVTQPKRKGGWLSPITPSDTPTLIEIVKKHPAWSYDEVTALWCRKTGKTVSRSAVIRKLKKLGFTRKKKSVQASEKVTKKNAAKRSRFRYIRKDLPAEKLVFLDEAGFQSKINKTHGLAVRGKRVVVYEPAAFSKNFTVAGAVRLSGPVVMHGSCQSMTAKRFLSFLRTKLLPRLRPGDIIVMDNLAAHRTKSVRTLCRQWDVRVIYLPPYSPEFNPIENVWSWMKNRLRKRINRAADCFRYAIAGAWRKAAQLRMVNLFHHAGYLGPCEVT